MDPHDLLGLVLEVFTWIGFGSAVVVLIVMLIARAADGSWVETHGVIVDLTDDADGGQGREVRWMTESAELYSRPVTDAEIDALRDPEEPNVFYARREPSRARFRRTADHTRALRLLFGVTFGIGVVCSIASIVLLFVADTGA
ncbi:DUF3592 domain-containing protein [Plantibacter sp. H53]|uniref:DUF3592 domain-containing protein n=1 Tax=Plantibacter sp. H53 TaxID=1827323 RepID=UPI0018D439A8|nr:DUF3592 domain-containing protein [Plantibacter sp. H53]